MHLIIIVIMQIFVENKNMTERQYVKKGKQHTDMQIRQCYEC